jgi:hypothetical protein
LAVLEPGAITLTPFLGGVRFLKKKPVRVDVVRADRYEQRSTTVREAFSAMPGMTVVQVHTPTAVLDWVIQPDVVAWATERVTVATPQHPLIGYRAYESERHRGSPVDCGQQDRVRRRQMSLPGTERIICGIMAE